jgi:protein TonB
VKGNLQGLITSDDYPESAIRNNETGRVTVRLSIGTNGRVTGCDVVGSSGSRTLDSTTCRILSSRARFSPAKLSNGSPTTDTYTQSIVWQLQG